MLLTLPAYPGQETDVISFATFQIQDCSSLWQVRPLGTAYCWEVQETDQLILQCPEAVSPFPSAFILLTLHGIYNLLKLILIMRTPRIIRGDLTNIQLILSVWAAYRTAKPANIS